MTQYTLTVFRESGRPTKTLTGAWEDIMDEIIDNHLTGTLISIKRRGSPHGIDRDLQQEPLDIGLYPTDELS